MSLFKRAQEIIKTLTSKKVYAQCPCCDEPILLSKAGLFYLDNFSRQGEALYQMRLNDLEERKRNLKQKPKTISAKSEISAKSINVGAILERITPALSSFRFDRNDCRSLFDPIDYVIFENLNKKGKVSRIIFAEIKTGKARLTQRQQEIKSTVESGKVVFQTYSEAITR